MFVSIMKKIVGLLLIGIFVLSACNKANNSGPWLIPSNEVQDGGPGKDGIPSLDNPQFSAVNDIGFLNEEDLVVGLISENGARAYPHNILDWHEIVNDDFGTMSIALTYCPLTGTAVGWDRNVNGSNTSFGVSGKLYNTNLIPYDRKTDSYWSQIGLNCVNGELISTEINTIGIIETSWSTWKKAYPNSEVLNTNTGFNRNYSRYPYGDYRTNNNNIIFPVSPMDNRLPAKERVLGVLENGVNKAYSINQFVSPRIINDTLNGQDIIVVGSRPDNFIVSFYNHDQINWTIDLTNLPIIAQSDNGQLLSLSGDIIDGSGTTSGQEKLDQPVSFIGYWFSFGAFYPDIQIYE